MPTQRIAKTGYWRINPQTGEAEWIEGSYQPPKPDTIKQTDVDVGEIEPVVPPVSPPSPYMIYDYETDQFVSVSLEEFQRREQFYQQFPEVAPLGTLGKITTPQFEEQQRIKELETTLRTVYPEMFDPTRSFGFTLDQIPTMVVEQLMLRMQEDYEGFLQDLTARVGRIEAENILKQFGFQEDFVLQGLDVQGQEERTLSTIQAVLPEIENLESFGNLIDTDWESFFETIRTGGMNAQKRQLLELMEFTPDEINQIAMRPRLVVEVEGIRRQLDVDLTTKAAYDLEGNYIGMYNPATKEFTQAPPRNVAQKAWDWLAFSSRQYWEMGESALIGILPEIIYSEIPLDKAKRSPVEKLFSDDVVNFLNQTSREQRENWRFAYRENRLEYDDWLRKNPDIKPSIQYQQGAFQNPELLKDPMYYVYEFTNILPLVLATATIGVGTGGVGLPFFAISTGMMGAVEGGAVYQDLLDAGAPEDRAAGMAAIAGGIIGSLESVGRIPLLKQISPLVFGKFKRDAARELARQGLAQTIKKFGTNFTITMFSETLTEVAQEIVGNVAVRVYDENRSVFENVPDIATKTAVGMLGFGLFGAGVSTRMVTSSELRGLSDVAKKAKGWVTDQKGNWYAAVEEARARPERGAFEIPGKKPEEVTPAPSNPYMNMPIERVRRDAEHGVKLAKEALAVRKAVIPEVTPAEPIKPSVTPPTEAVVKPEITPAPEVTIPYTRESRPINMGATQGLRLALERENVSFTTSNPTLTEIVAKLDEIDARLAAIPKRYYRKSEGLRAVRETILRQIDIQSGLTEKQLRQVLTQPIGAVAPIPKAEVAPVVAEVKEIFTGITEAKEVPTIVAEEKVTPPAPPPQPPQTVEVPLPPPSPDAKKRVITQSQEVVKQSMPGAINRLFQKIPGIGQIMRWERPALRAFAEKYPHLLVAQVVESAARSDVAARQVASRLPLFKQLHDVFGERALRGEKTDIKFIGTEEQAANPITSTLLDIAQNPELYELTPTHLAALEAINKHNDFSLDYVVKGYGAEIGRFAPKPNGAFLSNVDISEDMMAWFENESRAVAQGRGKTRFWQTARDRMTADKTFQPELDIKKLIEGMDSFKASQAGGVTFKEVAGGKTRLEAMEETHPALFDRMLSLRSELQALKRNLANLETRLEDRVTEFLESSAEDADVATLQESLDVRLQKGRFVAFNIEALQEQIDTTKEQIKKLRTPWKVANLKPYVFVQQGLYRYFKPLEAKYIIDSRKTTNNPILNFIERWRGQAFSGDFSPFAIQGSIGVLADPIGSLKATAGGIEAAARNKDLLHSITVDGLIDDVNSDIEGWAEFASLMGRELSGVPREYAAGFLSSIPGFDKFTETTYITVTRGTKNLYDRTWQGLVKNGVPILEAKVAAIEVASKVYPLVSPAKLGQSQARAAVLRAMPTSYSFIRQPATLIAQASMGYAKLATFQKLTPQERIAVVNVTRMAASILVVSATSAVLSAIAQGKDDEEVWQAFWDAINPDPYNGKFASIIIGDFRIPLGGPYRAIFRAIYPQEVEGIPFPVPFAGIPRFVFNRITPAVKTQVNLLMNKDYYGKQIIKGQFPENIIRAVLYEMEGALPLSLGELMAGFRREEFLDEIVQGVAAQFVGVNLIKLDNTYFHKLVKNLGLPKQEAPSLYSDEIPNFSTKDIYSKVTSVLSDETLDEVKKRKGYPKLIAIILEARDLKREVELLPNRSPVSLKAEDVLGEKGYYAQWKQRQSLIDASDDAESTVQELVGGKYKTKTLKGEDALKAFDKENPQAELGNMSQRQYSLLVQYHALTDDKDKKQFLQDHPEIDINPRTEYLTTHPKENAQLAVWGQAKILTKEAYNQFKGMVKELDIPDSALPEMTLPPKGSIDNYFKYQDMGNKNSWEVQLMLKKDNDLREFLGRQPITTPIASLELKVNNQANFDKLDAFSDKDSPDYIADVKARTEAVKKFRTDNPEFVDDTRRIEAIEKGTDENPIDEKLVSAHVEYGKLIGQEGIGSSSAEAMLYRVDNPDYDAFRTDGTIWDKQALTPIDQSTIPVWRIDVKYRKEDAEYEAIKSANASEQARLRQEYLGDNPEYRMDRRRREAYSLTNSATGELFPSAMVESYVAYYEYGDKGFRRERFLVENPDFANAMHRISGMDLPDPAKIPSVEYDNIYDEWIDEFGKFEGLADNTSEFYIEDPIARQAEYDRMRYTAGQQTYSGVSIKNKVLTGFGLAEIKRDAYGKFVPDEYIDTYVQWGKIQSEGKPKDWDDTTKTSYWFEDDWFLMENKEFYDNVYVGLFKNERKDFRKVPDRLVFEKYLIYVKLPHQTAKKEYRAANLDLEEWGVLRFDWTPIREQERREKLTPYEKFMEEFTEQQTEIEERLRALR